MTTINSIATDSGILLHSLYRKMQTNETVVLDEVVVATLVNVCIWQQLQIEALQQLIHEQRYPISSRPAPDLELQEPHFGRPKTLSGHSLI